MLLIATEDLAVSSGIAGAAGQAGIEFATAMTREALLARCRDSAPKIVLLDLTTRWADPASLLPELRAACDNPVRVIAFGPHVHEALLSAATAAGCDEVLTRGRFHATLAARLAALRPSA